MDNSLLQLAYTAAVLLCFHGKQVAAMTLTAGQQITLLNLHNQYRGGEGASDMNSMLWSANTRLNAQNWVDQCDVTASKPSSSGQTTFGLNYYEFQGDVNLTEAIEAWFSEKANYNYDGHTCGLSGTCLQYLQLVYAETKTVACASQSCNSSGEQTNLLACLYSPGLDSSVRPYKLGGACTQCSSGTFLCKDGNCRDVCGTAESCTCAAQCGNCSTVTSDCKCQCQGDFTGIQCTVGTTCDVTTSAAATQANQASSSAPTVDSSINSAADLSLTSAGVTVVSQDNIAVDSGITSGGVSTDSNVASDSGTQSSARRAPPTTVDPTDCSNFKCSNGGTPYYQTRTNRADRCSCNCVAEKTGRRCRKSKKQASDGVAMTTDARLSLFDTLWALVKPIIVTSVNDHCRMNVPVCCPGYSQPASVPSDTDFMTSDDIQLGDGYPDFEDNQLSVLFYISASPSNPLCTLAKPVRRKRQTATASNSSGIILPQSTLQTVVSGASDQLSTALSDCCNATLVSVQPGLANEGLSMSIIVIAAGVAAAVVAVLVILVTVLVKSNRKGFIEEDKKTMMNNYWYDTRRSRPVSTQYLYSPDGPLSTPSYGYSPPSSLYDGTVVYNK